MPPRLESERPRRGVEGAGGMACAVVSAIQHQLNFTMSDDKTKKGPQDSNRVNVHEDHEVRYWREKFGCTEEELVNAVGMAGTSADAVEEYLNARK